MTVKVTHISNAEYVFKLANNLPVFSLTGSGIGYWAIGGNIPRYDAVNSKIHLAQKAYDLLDKKIDAKPDFFCYPNEFKIDMNMIKAFRLENKQLPLMPYTSTNPIRWQPSLSNIKDISYWQACFLSCWWQDSSLPFLIPSD